MDTAEQFPAYLAGFRVAETELGPQTLSSPFFLWLPQGLL